MGNTEQQYTAVSKECRSIYSSKLIDYGPSWRILRQASITDQLYIKAKRIRSIQEKQVNKVNEGIEGEFIALINYSIIALIQSELNTTDEPDIDNERAMALYDKKFNEIKELMFAKNHDYGEAWRDMRISSMTDLILVKLFRIKQIQENEGQTIISEGIESNFMDIANYAVFCLILLGEQTKN